MLFKPEHIEQIRAGGKTVTRRDWDRPQVLEDGIYIASTEMFTSHDEADCYIRVTAVREEPLGAITPAQADREGGYSVDEFEEVWREINGSYDPAKRVTVVEFEYVGRSHPDEDETEQTILSDGSGFCVDHRESLADDSPRGEAYPDDRTELAYVYDGESLRAVLYDEREVRRYREDTSLTISLTPAGECRVAGRHREQTRPEGDLASDGPTPVEMQAEVERLEREVHLPSHQETIINWDS